MVFQVAVIMPEVVEQEAIKRTQLSLSMWVLNTPSQLEQEVGQVQMEAILPLELFS